MPDGTGSRALTSASATALTLPISLFSLSLFITPLFQLPGTVRPAARLQASQKAQNKSQMSCLCHVTFSYSLLFFLFRFVLFLFICALFHFCLLFAFVCFVAHFPFYLFGNISLTLTFRLRTLINFRATRRTQCLTLYTAVLFFFWCQHLPHPVACIILDAHTSFYDIYFYGGYLCSGPFSCASVKAH